MFRPLLMTQEVKLLQAAHGGRIRRAETSPSSCRGMNLSACEKAAESAALGFGFPATPDENAKTASRFRELFGNKVGEGQSRLFCCSLSRLCPHGVADTRRSCKERSRRFVFRPCSARVSLHRAHGIHLRRSEASGDRFSFDAPPHRHTSAPTPSRRVQRAPDRMCRRAYYCGSTPRSRHRARDNSRLSDQSPRPAHVRYRLQRHRGGPAG
jgi:hypothetical protein